MIDKEKIRKIKLDKREKEVEREIEKAKMESQMELDALKKQVEKLQYKLSDTEQKLNKSEVKEYKEKLEKI